ncbi:hypothetical protein K504DRAFT_469283 [Pleomassaria siparia CBS 279.74]|uniref:DUF1989 domain-containing protein n=1 Tax=Pleomassaria siparia CBS 279.74 TaxID=1314801 RepID=A0A6G1KQ43_9PLEO|nr:hypothetical protein K504DRAFT_469283 [Pleomassaria siparia CBS 279.74]
MPEQDPPPPAYFPTTSTSPLHPPHALYSRLASLPPSSLTQTLSLTIPPRSGRAFHVAAGSLFRFSTPEGAQVGDLNVWNQHNPRERFWATRTRQLQGSHLVEGDRLWSCLPYMRPLCGVVEDGCQADLVKAGREKGQGAASGEGPRDERGSVVSKAGGRMHDLLGTRCDPYVSTVLTGTQYDYHCHSNLTRAVTQAPFHLSESDVHDVVNIFQVTGLDASGRYFMEASPCTPSSYITFFAEQDLLVALSTCPGGDLSAWGWAAGEGAVEQKTVGDEVLDVDERMKRTCRPIKVDVWEVNESEREEVLRGWTTPEGSAYKGAHGMGIPRGETPKIQA